MTEGAANSVPISVVAKIMGKSSMFVRIGLQRGLLPFGTAFKIDESHMQYDYYVSPKLLYEYTGYMYEPNEDDTQVPIVTTEKCSSELQKGAQINMSKTINYSIRTAKISGKVYYSVYDIANMLGIDSKTVCIQLGYQKPITIICLEGPTKGIIHDFVPYDDLVKLIAFGNKVNPADIKLYTSDIPLKDIEKDQLKAIISVEAPSEANGQVSSVTVLADKVYSTTDIAKEYRMDISTFHKYLECRNVLHREWKTHKYLLCDRFCGKGLVVNIPNVKYLRWTEKGKKLLEYMLKQDGYEKVVRKHG